MTRANRRDDQQHRAKTCAPIVPRRMRAYMSSGAASRKVMEDLPSSPDDAITASLKLVDEAEIYVGIFAHPLRLHAPIVREIRSGARHHGDGVPPCGRARTIPVLIFLIDPAHPATGDMLESGESARANAWTS